jgi:hypothetical protein
MEDSQLRANAAVDELSMLILAQAAELFDAPRADLHRPQIDRRAAPKRPEDYTAADALRNFRFAPADLRTLITALGIPDRLKWETKAGHWNWYDGEQCFLILLRRMANINRCADLEAEFNMSGSEISRCQSCMTKWLDAQFGHLVSDDVAPPATWPAGQPTGLRRWHSQVDAWKRSIKTSLQALGIPELDHVFGEVCLFLDGFFAGMARPSAGVFRDLQRAFYTRFQGGHGMLFQSVIAPTGLFVDVYGPSPGHQNDINNQAASMISQRLLELFGDAGGTAYGDGIYQVTASITRAQGGLIVAEHIKRMNRALNALRVCVENGFSKLTQLWKFMRAPEKCRLLDSSVGLQRQFRIAFLLTNCHTCLSGSQTGNSFGCTPPSVASYLQGGVAPK